MKKLFTNGENVGIIIEHVREDVLCAPVAQLDRASDSGSEGWGFESLRAYHKATPIWIFWAERLEYQRVWLFYFSKIYVLKKRYFRGIQGHRKGLPLNCLSFRAPIGISALFEHIRGAEIRKNDIQKTVRRFVGFVNHQAGAFLLPGKFKKGVFVIPLEVCGSAARLYRPCQKGHTVC